MKRLAIYTAATAGYTYALKPQARAIQAALFAAGPCEVKVIVVSDGNKEAESACDLYRQLLPSAEVEHVSDARIVDGHENYKPDAQLVIATMRTLATSVARAWGADYLLALDSDVIPKANSIRCMLDMLAFDGGYYGVAACPYPSQGGGDFLCGRGTPQNPILPDFHEDEKEVPAELVAARDAARETFQQDQSKTNRDALKAAEDAIRAVPPKGNVFAMNAEVWRQRGWFSQAYPGIGKGAIVPTDWCGFGCTMMGREAMALCDFTGYDGQGTEDLFIVFHRWWPAGIRIAAIPHCPADHIIREKVHDDSGKETGVQKIRHCFAGHEGQGECVGHLRQQRREWHPQEVG